MQIWYIWSVFYTVTRFDCPYQSSSDRALVSKKSKRGEAPPVTKYKCKIIISNYEGWNFNSGNYLFTTDTK